MVSTVFEEFSGFVDSLSFKRTRCGRGRAMVGAVLDLIHVCIS